MYVVRVAPPKKTRCGASAHWVAAPRAECPTRVARSENFIEIKSDALSGNFLHVWNPTKTVNDGFLVCSSVGNMRFTQDLTVDSSGNLTGVTTINTIDPADIVQASSTWGFDNRVFLIVQISFFI